MKKIELWKQRLEEHKESGLSISAWCVQQGLKAPTFHYWSRKLTEDIDMNHDEVTFVELPTFDEVDSINIPEDTVSIDVVWNQCNITITSIEQAKLAAGFIYQLQKLC